MTDQPAMDEFTYLLPSSWQASWCSRVSARNTGFTISLQFHGFFLLLFMTGAQFPSERSYRLVVTGSALILGIYIGMLFLNLH